MLKFVLGIIIGAMLNNVYLMKSEMQYQKVVNDPLLQLHAESLAGEHLVKVLKVGEVYRVMEYVVYNDGKKIVSISPIRFADESVEIWTHEPDLVMQPLGTRFKLHQDGSRLIILGSYEA